LGISGTWTTPSSPGANPNACRDAPRRDDRNSDGAHDLRQERKQTGLTFNVLGQEHPAMTARFRALSDDRVDATTFQPFRNDRIRLLDDLGHRRVERRPDRSSPAGRWVKGGFGVVRR
jgi:hypothetical protein